MLVAEMVAVDFWRLVTAIPVVVEDLVASCSCWSKFDVVLDAATGIFPSPGRSESSSEEELSELESEEEDEELEEEEEEDEEEEDEEEEEEEEEDKRPGFEVETATASAAFWLTDEVGLVPPVTASVGSTVDPLVTIWPGRCCGCDCAISNVGFLSAEAALLM